MVKRSRTQRYVVLAAILAFVAFGLLDTWPNLARWLINLEVAHTGEKLQRVDQVDVFLLGNLRQQGSSASPAPADFMGLPVEGRGTLDATDAEAIAKQWRAIPRGYQYLHLCHEPLYGLRFQRGNEIVLETTVCWNCETYDFKAFRVPGINSEMWEWGFDAHSTPAQILLGLLVKKVPPPVEEQKYILKDFPESSSAAGP